MLQNYLESTNFTISTTPTTVFIPLIALNVESASNIQALLITNAYPGIAQPTIYISNIQLVCQNIDGGTLQLPQGSTPQSPFSLITPVNQGNSPSNNPSSSLQPTTNTPSSLFSIGSIISPIFGIIPILLRLFFF